MGGGGEDKLESLWLGKMNLEDKLSTKLKISASEKVGDKSKCVEHLTPLLGFERGDYLSGRKSACPRVSTTLFGIASGVGRAGGTGLPIGGRQRESATSGETSQPQVAVQRVHQPGRGGAGGQTRQHGVQSGLEFRVNRA